MKSQKSDTESAESTAPLDETPSWVTAVPGGENDPVTRVPSRSLRELPSMITLTELIKKL